MRTEAEMMELIIDVAVHNDLVRAVLLSGSRANPNAPRDRFQDYDIVYLVTSVEPFAADPGWIDVFGERMIMQMPEPLAAGQTCYLMRFTDGNRIDLTLAPVAQDHASLLDDKLTVVLLDKDGLIPELPPPTDADRWVKPPSRAQYDDCCNEFWWVSNYVAKGLCRREMLYAMWHLDRVVREMLLTMLEWEAGIRTEFSVSVGKCRKYLEAYIPRESWHALMLTYPGGNYESCWGSLFAACELFRSTARLVAEEFGYEYPADDDQRVTAYLQQVRSESGQRHSPGQVT